MEMVGQLLGCPLISVLLIHEVTLGEYSEVEIFDFSLQFICLGLVMFSASEQV